MRQHFRLIAVAKICAATALAGLALASCAPQHSEPLQVQATSPSVTYKYQSDQDLVQANQKAAAFCAPYQSVPRHARFSNEADGSRTVVFECMQAPAQVTMAPQYNPNLVYSYRTDQELLDASRNAQVHCMNNGGQQVISTMGTDASGAKTVVFQCSPRTAR